MTTFSFDRELRFGDCDPSGIAYFPSYLNILNGVVEDFWARIGFPWPELITVRKIGTPTVHLSCDFSRPSMFGDRLTFNLQIARVGGSSLHLEHAVPARTACAGAPARSWPRRRWWITMRSRGRMTFAPC